jgi:hypothetical protein
VVVDPPHHRRAGLWSPHVDIDALTLYRSDKARCQSELLCRDATQFTGLTDGQARSHAKRTVHFNARLSAVTCAKLDARQHNGDAASGVSLASLKRRAVNQPLIERLSPH